MNLRWMVLIPGLTAGCAGIDSRQAEQIDARLARMEARLDELSTLVRVERTLPPSTEPAPSGLVVQNPAKLAAIEQLQLVMGQVTELQSSGFTDGWPPLRQAKEEAARWREQVSKLPDSVPATAR